jgi:glycosyltransferase involved in cell wall biosynthesis
MRVLVFHGYLLRGTGSNVYNAELAQALARHGHDVHLLSQDRDAGSLPWVDEMGRWTGDGFEAEPTGAEPGHEGSVTVYVPEIGGLLPVYVHDRYPGFEVKPFPELSDDELARYLDANVEAVRAVAARAGGVDAALANHLVMGPVILARAGLEFATKVHGSDLSYTVRPHPERFVPFAREGIEASAAALVGSRHTAEDLWKTVAVDGLEARTVLGPPGVDVERFRPLPPEEAETALRELARELDEAAEGGEMGRDTQEAARAAEWFADADGGRVLFVGKFLVNKGVDLLAAAWPLVHREHPDARLLLTGFGAFRPGLERLLDALARGDLDEARELAEAGRRLEGGGEAGRLRLLAEFLADPSDGYADAAADAAGSVAISGRLEHSEIAAVTPAADALVMPSTFPEAFGMVAAEAAACGALPISAAHSGMLEVSRRLAEAAPSEIAPLLSFEVESDPVRGIAERLETWLAIVPHRRRQVGAALASRAAELWGWEGVARGVIAASRGELEDLPRP